MQRIGGCLERSDSGLCRVAGDASLCQSFCPSDRGQVFGIYESTAGSAPDIAGQGIANPMIGTFLSVGMMFTYSFGVQQVETDVEAAVHAALQDGIRTPDLGESASRAELTGAVLQRLGS